MFALFRFDIMERLITTIIVCVMMSQVSYITRLSEDIGDLSSYIQLVVMMFVLWLLFKVPWYYSILMNFVGFIVGFVVQGAVLITLNSTGLPMKAVQQSSTLTALVILLTAFLVVAIARTIVLLNLGFDFVPPDRRAYVPVTGLNALILASIITTLTAAVIAALVLRNNYTEYAIVASALFAVTTPFLIYYSVRKDRYNDGKAAKDSGRTPR